MKAFIIHNMVTGKLQLADTYENAQKLSDQERLRLIGEGKDTLHKLWIQEREITTEVADMSAEEIALILKKIEARNNKLGTYYTKTGTELTLINGGAN